MTLKPEIWLLHTANPREGESSWGGCYIVEADAENDAASMRKATGLDWEVVPMVRAAEQGKCLHQIAEPAAPKSALVEALRAVCTDMVAIGNGQHAITDEVRNKVEALQGVLFSAAPQAVQPAVPEGWTPVPMEGTEEMARAFRAESTPALFYMTTIQCVDFQERYRAMIAAAPAHPAEGVPVPAEVTGLLEALESMVDVCEGHDFDGAPSDAHMEKSRAAIAAYRATLSATQPAAQGLDAREFPPMTPELASILGLMCFQCISFAQALRAGGHQIASRAEDEQAAVLHWMLGHYFRHGDDWRTVAAEDMKRMETEALAAQAKQGGA